jgi:hypothetical protein
MADVVTTEQAMAPSGLPVRLFGILTSPRAAYAQVAARPRWFGVLAVLVTTSTAANFIFLSTKVGQDALFNQQLRTMEMLGFTISDRVYDQLVARLAWAPYLTAAGEIVFLPLVALIVSAVFFAVFVAILGADGSFREVFSTVAHSGVIIALQPLFVLPLDYARRSMSPPTTLAVFFPMLSDTSFFMHLLGAIDLFLIWWIVSLSIGLGVLFKRQTGPIATGLLGLYVILAVVVAAWRS